MRRGNQHGGCEYDNWQNLLDMTPHVTVYGLVFHQNLNVSLFQEKDPWTRVPLASFQGHSSQCFSDLVSKLSSQFWVLTPSATQFWNVLTYIIDIQDLSYPTLINQSIKIQLVCSKPEKIWKISNDEIGVRHFLFTLPVLISNISALVHLVPSYFET